MHRSLRMVALLVVATSVIACTVENHYYVEEEDEETDESSSSSSGGGGSSGGASGSSSGARGGSSGTTGTSSGGAGSSSGGSSSGSSGERPDVDDPASCSSAQTGPNVGNVLLAESVALASGGSYSFRDHCGRPVYILSVTESCGICMGKMNQWSAPGALFDQLKEEGADLVFIHGANAQGQKPSAQETTSLIGRFELERFYVAVDTASAYSSASFMGTNVFNYGARIAIALKDGNVIGARGQLDTEQAIRNGLGL